jgi:hypothetical protein
MQVPRPEVPAEVFAEGRQGVLLGIRACEGSYGVTRLATAELARRAPPSGGKSSYRQRGGGEGAPGVARPAAS